jgi:serine/threonine protein kinase
MIDNEVKLLENLKGAESPNVIQIFDHYNNGETGLENTVLEKAHGGDLMGFINRQRKAKSVKGSFDPLALQLMRDIDLGITQLHTNSDIKPANLSCSSSS